jgi:hypothetical protein
LSGSFKEHINDINVWTMTGDIFNRWPEFFSDIPAFSSLGIQLSINVAGSIRAKPSPPAAPQSRETDDEDTQGVMDSVYSVMRD